MSKPAEYPGCSDHNCVWGFPYSVGTNGGCHCLDEIRRKCGIKEMLRIREGIRWVREHAADKESVR